MFCFRNRGFITSLARQIRNVHTLNVSRVCVTENVLNVGKRITPNLESCRHKSKNKAGKQVDAVSDSDEEDQDIIDGLVPDKTSKVMQNVHVPSMRIDAILKTGLGITRTKIDPLFYDDKLRLNGRKVLKKSEIVSEGDEVDVVREVHPNNVRMLNVSRVEVLKVKQKDDGYVVTLRRNKSLLVDNYDLQ